MKRFLWALPLAAIVLAGCSHSPSTGLLRKYNAKNSVASFTLCHNYGCTKADQTGLTDAEWQLVRAQFAPRAADAGAEREQIRHAVALIEKMVGPKTGTDVDGPGAPIINLVRAGQMDCIDEAYNTSLYLSFFANDNLLAWHDVGIPAKRGMVIDRWFHNTATVTERGTGAQYTVDSWFGANGELPDVVPLQSWMAGWSPPKPGA